MSERNLRARRYLQAEHIVNNLKQSSAKPLMAPTKRIRKPRKRTPPQPPRMADVAPPASLPYIDESGKSKHVIFVIGVQEPTLAAESHSGEGTADTDINISEMFLRKYRQLLQSNLISDDFYANVAYDKDKEVLTLYNEDKEQGFEIYEREGKSREYSAEANEVMKEEDFEGLVKGYQLSNLYC